MRHAQLISLALRGGIGNQAYQIAALDYFTSLCETQGYIDLAHYTYLNNPRRPVILELAELAFYHLQPTVAQRRTLLEEKLFRKWPTLHGKIANRKILCDRPILENAIYAANLRSDILMAGYFQQHAFMVVSPFIEHLRKWCTSQNIHDNHIGVHLRLGDYTDPKYSWLYWIVDRDYINESFDIIENKISAKSNYKVFIFTDNIAMAKTLIEFTSVAKSGLQITYSDSQSPISDLVDLARCRYKILCNSTFSMLSYYISRGSTIATIPRVWFKERPAPAGLLPSGDHNLSLVNNVSQVSDSLGR